ncbi:MAG: amino acid racemase [Candidatus Korobacteraceae bacterium]|jgi:aspartate racemase
MAKTVGILGGMGPLATVDLFEKIIKSTPAAKDAEHLRIIIDNNPQIPSRRLAITRGTESPLPALIASARGLENAGADFIAIACNTAHYWIDDLRRAVGIPILNMITCCASYVAERFPELSGKVLLFAGPGTVEAKLYQKAFAGLGMQLHLPTDQEQKLVNGAIDQVKAGFVENNPLLGPLNAVLSKYAAAGIGAVLGGCTEIPILFPYLKGDFRKLDATAILAEAVVAEARSMPAPRGATV